jgi:hypothetical protein
MITFRDVSI